MPWVRRLAAAVVRALAIAECEDCPIADGFERRVVDLLERECPVAEVREWDRPSEQTVRLLPKVKPMVTPLGAVSAAPPTPPAARSARG
jgi:hypothetical protein